MPVVGITIGERKLNVKDLKTGDKLKTVRQPNNPYDTNAILVTNQKGKEIGFIAKEWAAVFSFKIDCGFTYELTVTAIENKHISVKMVTNYADISLLDSISF